MQKCTNFCATKTIFAQRISQGSVCSVPTNELQLISCTCTPSSIKFIITTFVSMLLLPVDVMLSKAKQQTLSATDLVSIPHRCLDAHSPSNIPLSLFSIRNIYKIFACFMYYTNKMFSFLHSSFAHKLKTQSKNISRQQQKMYLA